MFLPLPAILTVCEAGSALRSRERRWQRYVSRVRGDLSLFQAEWSLQDHLDVASLRQADLITAFEQDSSQTQGSAQTSARKQADAISAMRADDGATNGAGGSRCDNLLRLVHWFQSAFFVTRANVPGAGDTLQRALNWRNVVVGKNERCEAEAKF